MHQADGSRILVLGVGSPYRGDDRAGFEVIERLSSKKVGAEGALRKTADPAHVLLSMSERPEQLIIVDALRNSRTDGLLRLDNPDPERLSETAFCSTHLMGVEEGIRLGHTLDLLPETMILYGIPGTDFSYGSQLSDRTDRFVDQTVDEIEHKFTINTEVS